MEANILAILSALDATGATESTGPIRECIIGLEGRIADLETERAQLQETIAAYTGLNCTEQIDTAKALLIAENARLNNIISTILVLVTSSAT